MRSLRFVEIETGQIQTEAQVIARLGLRGEIDIHDPRVSENYRLIDEHNEVVDYQRSEEVARMAAIYSRLEAAYAEIAIASQELADLMGVEDD